MQFSGINADGLLQGLVSIDRDLSIEFNDSLTDVFALYQLTHVGNDAFIVDNGVLTDAAAAERRARGHSDIRRHT
jgi:hypothetical protein